MTGLQAALGRLPQAAWLAYWRLMRIYHRYEVEGFSHLEQPGPALLVGYHGRPIAHDLCMLTVTMHERLGYLPHGVIHSYFAEQPFLKWLIDGLGFVTTDGPELAAAVSRGEHILLQPGGTREGCRSFYDRYRVDWGERLGYLKLALRYRLPIIPIAGAGVDDGYIGLNDGYRLGKRLRLPYRLPLWFGIGLCGLWPFSPPLPVKMKQLVGAPIDPFGGGAQPLDPTDPAALLRLHRQVEQAVQELLDRRNAQPARAGRPGISRSAPASTSRFGDSEASLSLSGAAREILTMASYPAIGYLLRRRRWDDSELAVDLRGKVCIVTGASQGLGLGIAKGLARLHATVLMLCRDPQRGEAARTEVMAAAGHDRVHLCQVDIASLAAVRAFRDWFCRRFPRLDVLVHNVGIILPDARLSVDGVDLLFATNVLGAYHLTRELLPSLRAAAPSRIIHVGSAAQYFQRLDVEALLRPTGRYVAGLQYARSKRAVAELSRCWAARLTQRDGQGQLMITANCMHPGLTATQGVRQAFPLYHRILKPVLRDLEQGADTAVWLAASPAVLGETGKLWFDRQVRPNHIVDWTRCSDEESARLWNRLSELCGSKPSQGLEELIDATAEGKQDSSTCRLHTGGKEQISRFYSNLPAPPIIKRC